MNTNKIAVAVAMLIACGLASAQVGNGRMRIANEGTIGDKWKLAEGTTLSMPAYPAQFAARKADVCIALGYVIEPSGETKQFTVLKQWGTEGDGEPVDGYWKAFAEAGADALSTWRFAPKADAGAVAATHTVATLVFNGGAGTAPADLRAHCKIDDLASHLEKMKDKRWQRGDLNRRYAEQDRRRMEQQEINAAMRRAQQPVR